MTQAAILSATPPQSQVQPLIYAVFNEGYTIRKLIENLSETAQETIFYFSKGYIQCICEQLHGDMVQSRLLILTSELPKDCYKYTFAEEETAIGVNLVQLHSMLTGVKVKIGRIRFVFKSTTDLHVQTVNSLASDTEANWEDHILTAVNVERKYRSVEDYTVPPLATTKTSDFVRFCKEIKGDNVDYLKFSLDKASDGNIKGIFMSVFNKEGKYIKGKSIARNVMLPAPASGSTPSSENKDVESTLMTQPMSGNDEDAIKASDKLIAQWRCLTGLLDSQMYWHLDETHPLKFAITIDKYGWFMQWVG